MKFKTPMIALLALTLPLAAQAHRAWILPAATVLSGEGAWVTFDAAVSNDIFYTDHAPMRLDSLAVQAPDGSVAEVQNSHTGKFRSTFDLELKQEGTYKIFIASSGLRAMWEDEEGERQFWPGRGETPKPGEFDKAVPKEAKNLEVSQSSRRLETFVTAGAPSNTFAVQKEGLEMEPVTHPNDLFAGEEGKFRFLIDGEPAAGATVTIVPDGMRYRNEQSDIKAVADDNGLVSVTWPVAGLYWLEAEYSDERAAAPASSRQGQYVVTLEVLPQ